MLKGRGQRGLAGRIVKELEAIGPATIVELVESLSLDGEVDRAVVTRTMQRLKTGDRTERAVHVVDWRGREAVYAPGPGGNKRKPAPKTRAEINRDRARLAAQKMQTVRPGLSQKAALRLLAAINRASRPTSRSSA